MNKAETLTKQFPGNKIFKAKAKSLHAKMFPRFIFTRFPEPGETIVLRN